MTSVQGLTIKVDTDYNDANDELEDFDVIIVPLGDGVFDVLKPKAVVQLVSKSILPP
jgi:putative intracellular protease/amidase